MKNKTVKMYTKSEAKAAGFQNIFRINSISENYATNLKPEVFNQDYQVPLFTETEEAMLLALEEAKYWLVKLGEEAKAKKLDKKIYRFRNPYII